MPEIGELVPIRRRRRFVSRQEFAAMSRNAPAGSLYAFRADQDATADHEEDDPCDRARQACLRFRYSMLQS
jgi:hypothetical protein